MKRDMAAMVMALVISTVTTAAMSSGCGGVPKETVLETAREQEVEARIVDTTGESERDEESSAEAASGSYEDKTIGFVEMTLNNEYHITLANDAKMETEVKGVRIEIQVGDQHVSANAQPGIIEDMIANKVDGILLVSGSSDGLESTPTKCREAGIPITNLGTKLTDESLTNAGLDISSYRANNYESAKLADEYMAKSFEKGTRTAIFRGIEGQTNAANRYSGLIGGAGGTVTVVAEQTADWEVGRGYTAIQNIISVNPGAELFFCCNDNMGIGALRTIKEANMREQAQIIGSDAASGALNLVENGELLATVAQYPAGMGELGVDNMLKIFDGGEVESYIDTGMEVITEDNIGEFKDYLRTFGWEQGWSLTKDFSYRIRVYSRPQ